MESPIQISASFKMNVVDGNLQKIYEIGSLQEMCVLAVGVCLYRNFWIFYPNAYERIDFFKPKFFHQFPDHLLSSIPKLSLPSSIQEKILSVLGLLRTEILLWKNLLKGLTNFVISKDRWNKTMKLAGREFLILNELIWTWKGRTDMKKTAEVLVKNECYNLTFRFTLACIFCLESWIYKLWPIVQGTGFQMMTRKFHWFQYWSSVCKSRINLKYSLHTSHEFELNFYRAAVDENLAAMEYFLCKLEPNTIKQATMKIGKIYLYDRYYDGVHLSQDLIELKKEFKEGGKNFILLQRGAVFEFLSPLITSEEKLSLAKEYPRAALECSLHSDKETEFLELANSLYPLLEDSDVVYILNTLFHIQMFDCKYFEKFWLSIPKALREQIPINKIYSLLPILFHVLCNNLNRARESSRLFCKNFRKNLSEMTKTDFYLFKFFLFLSASSSDELVSLQVKISNNYFLKKIGETDFSLLIRFLNDKFSGTFSELCSTYQNLLKSDFE